MEEGTVKEESEWNNTNWFSQQSFLFHMLAKTLCLRNWPEARVSLYLSCVSETLGLDWLSSQAAGIPGKAQRPVWGLVLCQWLMRTSARGDTLWNQTEAQRVNPWAFSKWGPLMEKIIFIPSFNFAAKNALLITSSLGEMPACNLLKLQEINTTLVAVIICPCSIIIIKLFETADLTSTITNRERRAVVSADKFLFTNLRTYL